LRIVLTISSTMAALVTLAVSLVGVHGTKPTFEYYFAGE